MEDFKQGQSVWVKVDDIQPGPFDEKLILIKVEPANISGFVKNKYVDNRGPHTYIVGTIVDVTPNVVELHLPGSFFTAAAGVASVSKDWALRNVEEPEEA